MTHDEAVSRIRIYIGGRADGTGRSDVSSTLISSMLNERLKMLSVPFRFPQHETTGTVETVLDTDTIAMPAGVYVIDSVVDIENNKPLEIAEFDDYKRESIYATGLPRVVSFYGNTLYISPTPNGVYTLRWYGFALPTNVTGVTPLPVPEDWHPLVCKYTAADILFMKKQFESALGLKNEALGDLSTRVEARTFQRLQGYGQISIARATPRRRRGR
jgi:hypothetical protein